MKRFRGIIPAIIDMMMEEEPSGDRLPFFTVSASAAVPVYNQIRWGLRRIDTRVWYSPFDIHRKRLFPMSFGARIEAEATLRGPGGGACEIWEPKPFSDAAYQAAIAGLEAEQ